jgi:large subunit ribosomal protein L35
MSPRKKKGRKSKKYKLKTHKATAKRFRKTGSGKILRTKGHQTHLRRRKSKRAKRQLDQMFEVESRKLKQTIKRLAPYLDR